MRVSLDMEIIALVLLSVCRVGWSEQQCIVEGEVRCGTQDKCVPLRYICDNDPDCNDNSDEDPQLCKAWRTRCGRGEVPCGEGGDERCIPIADYCTATHQCHTDLDLRICQMLHNQRLQQLSDIMLTDFGPRNNFEESEAREEEFETSINGTLSHPACPPFHTLFGDQCLSIFFPAAVSWGEGRGLCRLLGGDLITSKNLTYFAALLKHLSDNSMTADFWVGGRYVNSSHGWTWLDNHTMDLGSPHWAVRHYNTCQPRNLTFPEAGGRVRAANEGACYHYQQAPIMVKDGREPGGGWCAALTYQHYYYLSDEDCLARKSPICVHQSNMQTIENDNMEGERKPVEEVTMEEEGLPRNEAGTENFPPDLMFN